MRNHNDPELGKAVFERNEAERRAKAKTVNGVAYREEPPADDIPSEPPAAEEPQSFLADMHDGEWLDAQVFPPLQYAVHGIVPEGLGLIVAPPKAGKSWLVANLGLAVAAGCMALGRIPVTRRPVLYLALEDGDRRLQDRFRKIMGGEGIPKLMHHITKSHPSLAPGMVEEFLALRGESKPFIIIDTLAKVRPAKGIEDSYQADYRFMARYKDIIDTSPGSTLLFVHHSRKAESADFVDSVSGTAGLAGAADFTLVLTRPRQSEDAVLEVTGRDVPEGAYALHARDGVLWELDGTDLSTASQRVAERAAQKNLGDRSLDVVKLVNDRAARGLPTQAADLETIGIEESQRGVILNRLTASGHLIKQKRGFFTTPVKSVVSVKTQDTEESSLYGI